jgi:preprotein translocase subunit SecG
MSIITAILVIILLIIGCLFMAVYLVKQQGKIESQDSIQPMSNIDYEEMQSDVHKNTK